MLWAGRISYSDRWAIHTDTEGRCFAHLDAFSGEIHSASSKLKENYETQREERYIIQCKHLVFYNSGRESWLPLASMNTRHCSVVLFSPGLVNKLTYSVVLFCSTLVRENRVRGGVRCSHAQHPNSERPETSGK